MCDAGVPKNSRDSAKGQSPGNNQWRCKVENSYLKGKRVLVVDDEPDVLDTLEDLLPSCEIFRATSFQEGKQILDTQDLNLAILDIMGVDGYQLLDMANEKGVLSVMLTAHALSPEQTEKAYKRGAAFFIPKEKMSRISTFLKDVFEAKEKGENYWTRWLERFNVYYDQKFGPDWKETHKAFWEALSRQDWRLASVLRQESEET